MEPDPGLSEEQASHRLTLDGPNELPTPHIPGLFVRLGRRLAEPLALILGAAAVLSFFVLRERAEGLAITAVLVVDLVIEVGQERRSDRAMDALRSLTAPTARVRRGGHTRVVPARELVLGDVVELAAGDRIPADARLVSGVAAAADEALLTGESLPVEKSADDDIFEGTILVRGRAVGVVTATGARTRLGAIATGLGTSPPSPLQRELAQVTARVAVLSVTLGALFVVLAYLRSGGGGRALGDAVLAGVALAVAAVPEGLPAVTSTALALGALRLARRGAIVRNLAAIESLGTTTVLCTDKTGTLTTGHLAVSGVFALNGREEDLWRATLRCNDAADGVGDPVDVALARAAEARGTEARAEPRLDERPFDAATGMMSTVHETAAGPIITVKGAPESVLARVSPGAESDALERAVAALTERGLRTLALAAGAGTDPDAGGLVPLGAVALSDPLRTTAAAAVADCRAAGIRLVLVTGDHAATAHAVARDAGMADAPLVTGAELAALDQRERAARLGDAAVVARVDPSLKVELVDAHRAREDVVAMTGDGVNDAPALRRADVGVALAGAGGTDVAREAADLVVTDNDLGTLVTAVREGRRIDRNLRSVVAYLLGGNISEVLVVIAGLFLLPDLVVPLLPAQLLWINVITDGIPAVALGVDRPPGDPLRRPPRSRGERLLSWRRLVVIAGMGAVVTTVVVASGLIARSWGWSDEQVRTQLFLSLMLAHLMLPFAVRADVAALERGWWRSPLLLVAIGASVTLHALVSAIPATRAALGLRALPPQAWLLGACAAALTLALLDAARAVARRAGRRRAATA